MDVVEELIEDGQLIHDHLAEFFLQTEIAQYLQALVPELVHVVEGRLEQFEHHLDEVPFHPDLVQVVEGLIVVLWEVEGENDDESLQQLSQLLLMVLHALSKGP